MVFVIHALLVLVLIDPLRPAPVAKALPGMTISISPGGPRLSRGMPPKLDLKSPNDAAVLPPDIVIVADPPQKAISMATATGGPAVTVPAEAIGEFHSAPPLTGIMLAASHRAQLRLLLTVAADGSIAGAVVETSSGLQALDALAVSWVQAHWRYRPAMQDGHAISVTTTAVVPF